MISAFQSNAFQNNAFQIDVNSTAGQTILMPGGTLSRKRYEQIRDEIRAAEAKAQKLKKKQKEALQAAAEAVQEAVSGVGLLPFAPDFEPLSEALQAATGAKAGEVIARSAEVIRMAENLMCEMEDEEDILTLLLS